MSVCQ